ncbi:MAG: NAD(P)H-hydrate dehydratase [Anaerolineae bacterium CG2_30_64_16]|nr:MAG: NAD(P)H-hydrate dehydratase [Anaerolineae bacterium CG2_30_64_16]
MKLVSVEEMRRIEQATDAGGHSYAAMMDMAGHAVANMVNTLVLFNPERAILILVGPGNNGGDGLVAGRYLREEEHQITVYVWKRNVKGDENFRWLKRQRRGVAILFADNDPDYANLREELRHADVVVDALLGTGATLPIEGPLANILEIARGEISVRRAAFQEPAPQPMPGAPRFPVMDALTLGAPPPQPPPDFDDYDEDDADFDDFDEFDPDFDPDFDDEEEDDDDLPFWGEEDEEDDWLAQSSLPAGLQPPVVAVDCPSGLNCDTGELDPLALPATITITFAAPKWGHVQFPGAGACGLLSVADIGVPPALLQEVQGELVTPSEVRLWLPQRPSDAHKGAFGKVMIAGGSLSYTGAAYLSGAAAGRAGAGLVTLAIPTALHTALAAALPEATWVLLADSAGTHSAAGVPRLLASLADYDVLLVGPGLTQEDAARGFIETLFSAEGLPREAWQGRTIVDADALNILATLADWPARLPPGSILTPHPGEMARLTGATAVEVNARRIQTARRYAAEWGHIVLLKGPHTVIAAPDGRHAVLPFALPSLATAGSGDVLAGSIAALLAQGVPTFEAAVCGAYVHGHAGLLMFRAIGLSGTVASDLVGQLPTALRQLYSQP